MKENERLWEIIEFAASAIPSAYQALLALLIEECVELRTQAPEEGGWVRTTNTAYRAPSTPEVPPEVPEAEEGPENAPRRGRRAMTRQQRTAMSEATFGIPKTCSRCGKEGVNVRTCLETPASALDGGQRHRDPIEANGAYKMKKLGR